MTQHATHALAVEARGLLTSEQVQAFDRDGYLVLRQRIDGDLLRRLQDASQRWMAAGVAESSSTVARGR